VRLASSLGLLALAGIMGAACSLAIDVGKLQDGVCPEGTKACGEHCVSKNDPSYGCASDDCTPCSYLHAAARCSPQATCQLAACTGSFEDCDGDPANGCEVDKYYDPMNCGRCRNVCVVASATPACAEGVCAVERCAKGYSDCNHDGKDGCEVQSSTCADAGDAGGLPDGG
jgi:hypothetical protein